MNFGPINLRAFRAIDEPETCKQFFEGHVNVLKDYGIKPISSANDEWFYNPEVYGIIAEFEGRIVGGVKIHKVDGSHPLPVEESIGYMDDKIYDIVKANGIGGVGEACGLWNAKEVAGKGISFLLSRAIIVITNQINIQRVFAVSSDHTINMFKAIGFRIIRSLGKNGDFVYPSPQYVSRVVVVNSQTFSWATSYNKNRMFLLRENPTQKVIEQGPKELIDINYQLTIDL